MKKQPLDEFKDCNSDLLCRNCRPRLRRLEFEVNEMKFINAFLKECFHGCEFQNKDAEENLSGALSSRSRPTMNMSPTCFSNSSKLSSNDQICESSSPASKALVDLQEKLIEWMDQYCLLAHKYNEMVGQLQRCQDALLCSFKHTYELEKGILELQIQLKELLQIEHSSHENIFAQKLGVNQEFASPSTGAILQRLIKESNAQVDALNASMPNCVHDEPVAAAACIGSVISDYQRNMMPMCCTKSRNATLLPSGDLSQFLHPQETSLTSIPCVKMKAQTGDMAPPYSQPVHSDVSASESSWNSALSMLSLKNAATIESTPKKQQSSRQINTPLSEVTSPSDRFRLKSRSPSGTNENDTYISQADHSPVSSFPNACLVSPIACKQLHDEHGSTVINVPKIISIRANPQGGRLNCSSDQNVPDGPAYDAARTLSSLDLNKSYCHRHHSAPIRNEAEKQMKVVVLAKNMECMAFPQGAYKTEMCNKWVKSMGQYCPYKDKCQFAHGPHELRPVLRHCRYKSILCRMVAAGEVCPYEHRCHFRHVIYPHEAELLSLN